MPKDFFENNPIEPYSTPQFFLGSQILEGNEKLSGKLKKRKNYYLISVNAHPR